MASIFDFQTLYEKTMWETNFGKIRHWNTKKCKDLLVIGYICMWGQQIQSRTERRTL